jgi:hypothetical protein
VRKLREVCGLRCTPGKLAGLDEGVAGGEAGSAAEEVKMLRKKSATIGDRDSS